MNAWVRRGGPSQIAERCGRGIGFSWSRASKIGYRRPPGRSGSKDTDRGNFVSLRLFSGATQHALPTTIEETASPAQGLPESGLFS
eukprot:CAMPEP_0194304842 /NCGR_PEP_ID=MMETSP0171-20130528/2451_1 /TAXON_ID=218684 /ORGANISM="Corethron pennatum, Strain L29A3" /LENGTH=85 /DNA_ID=CAMNT_0039056213 /DNA_START=690 /DNA_END=944 /DNA_ORIENTATION=-